MLDIIVDNQVLFSLLEIYLPRVHQHISTYTTDLSPILTQWFLCLFVNTLPTELTLRVLDCFLFEGNKILLRVALGIFKCYEADILRTESFEDLFLLIAKPIQIQNANEFMTLIFDRIWLRSFGREKLSQLRQNVKQMTMEEEERKAVLRRSRTAARLEAAALNTQKASESNVKAEASSSSPSNASPRSEAVASSSAPSAASSSSLTSAAAIRADMTGISPPSRTSRFDPAKRKTIRISALPDDVKSVIDRRSWRAYKRSQEWHMIEEYFNSMEWSENSPSASSVSPRPDSGSRMPLSVTDPESVPKAAKTKLYKAHTVTSTTTPVVPSIAAPKISAARAQASASPSSNSPKSPAAPVTPTSPGKAPSNTNDAEGGTKRRSYAEVAKAGLEESSSSSSSTSPRGPPVQPLTQRKFFAATSASNNQHSRSTSNASTFSPKKSATSPRVAASPFLANNNTNNNSQPSPSHTRADRPPPNAAKKWSARSGFNTLGKNISSLVSSLTKSAVTSSNTPSTSNGTVEAKPTANGSSSNASSTTPRSPITRSSTVTPSSNTRPQPLPSAPTVPSVRLARQPTTNKSPAIAKLHTSPPTTPAPTPPPPSGIISANSTSTSNK